MAHDIFISHSSKDKSVADAVCAALENAAIRCWIAPRDVQPGRSFAGEIKRAIQNSKVMVLIFSAHSNNSDQVLREVQLAVNSHLHIVQFRIEDVVLNDDLSYFLSTPHWLDALTPPLEAHLQRLTSSINALLAPPDELLPQPASGAVAARRSITGSRENFGPAPWGAVGPFLQNNRKLIGLIVGAGLVLLSIWWFVHPARQALPTETAHHIPAPAIPASATPEYSTGPENPPRTTGTVYPSAEDYYRQQTAPSVASQNELPVRRRFILQHEDRVNDAHFSADGRFIVTASDDKTAQIWDARTGKPVGESLKHTGKVRQATFTPDGHRIMTVSNDVRLWDAGTQKEIGEPLGTHDLTMATLSTDGKLIAITEHESSSNRNAQTGQTETINAYVTRFWDAETRQMKGGTIRAKDHNGEHILVFSPDAKRIITDYGEREARIWDVASGQPVGDLLRHKYNVISASFSPDGRSVATWADQTKPRVWNAETGEQLLELQAQTGGRHSQILYSPDGNYLAVIRGSNYSGLIFNAKTGSTHGQQIPFPYAPAIFSPDSKELVTFVYSGGDAASVWETETGRFLTRKIQHDGEIEAMNFSSDGSLLVTASVDHTARVWKIGWGQGAVSPGR